MTQYLSQLYQRLNAVRGRRVFIIPTRFGFIYAGFLILILLGAINYSNSLGHVLCFLLASMGWVAMHHSYRNVAKIEFINAYANPVFAGQAIKFNLLFENRCHRTSYQIELTSKQSKSRSWNPFERLGGFAHNYTITQLKAGDTITVHYPVPSLRRGYQSLGQIRIASQFPLGLYHTWSYFTSDTKVLVYPQPLGALALPLSKDSGDQITDPTQKGNDDFSGLNTYRAGDPLRAIAWKALARDDVFRIKQFTGYQGGQLMLSWDAVAQVADHEARLSQLCKWILQADEAGIDYGLNLPNRFINYGYGDVHRHHCLTALALFDNE
ncbi:MAG: DUF58 domain-containing protein [Gammaproteobacteria bacterium]|nr:DUF58 domain-containing protein [Gammaproteobacteria bacterium]